jgi:serine/threonine protein kinase
MTRTNAADLWDKTRAMRNSVAGRWRRHGQGLPRTHLDRIVALKILPAAFSSDLDRLQRFQHEACILSTLNHPNVLAIFDVGERSGIRYLVSEFLEGQSMCEVLAPGALPRRAVAECALEMPEGLPPLTRKESFIAISSQISSSSPAMIA